MAKKYIDNDGLLYFWQKIKNAFVPSTRTVNGKALSSNVTLKTSDITNDSGYITGADIPEGAAASTTTPKMDGTAAVGTERAFARGDHVHPSDTSRVPTTRTVNGHALSANVTLNASDVGALPDSTTIPSAGTGSSYPAMDGTRSLGSNAGFARVDHVHPTDTSRVPTSRTINGKALSANVTLSGADINYDTGVTVTDVLDELDENKVDKVSGMGLSSNDYTTSEKTKLSGIATGAEVNQNAFSNVAVGSTTIAADGKTDTLTLEAGDNVTLTPDATNDKVTIAATDTVYTHPTYTSKSSGLYKITVNGTGHVSATASVAASDIPSLSAGKITSGTFAAARIPDLSGTYIATSQKGVASGVCPLNASSKIDNTYLPSYVDDVIEAYARSGQTALSENWLATGSASGTVITPEAGKIYILMADSGDYAANTQFRWSGTAYVKMLDGGMSPITNAEIDTIVAS